MLRRLLNAVCIGVGMLLIALWLWPMTMAAPAERQLAIYENPALMPRYVSSNTITLMAANLAHGRGNGRHQLKQSDEEIIAHLDAVSDVFVRYRPDIICLQEADAASWWSADLSHVQYVAGDLYHSAQALHVDGFGLHYGTGVLSRFSIDAAWGFTFDPTPPTMSKGFTLSKIKTTRRSMPYFYVASLHTDFASSTARQQQLDHMQQVLKNLDAPFIVAGDFNCAYMDKHSPMPGFLKALGLKTYQASSLDASLDTFRSLKRRIDWICIPEQWSFQSFHVLDDVVSDHSLIVANIAMPMQPIALSH